MYVRCPVEVTLVRGEPLFPLCTRREVGPVQKDRKGLEVFTEGLFWVACAPTPVHICVIKVLLEHGHIHVCIYLMSRFSHCNRTAEAETIQPLKPMVFTLWAFSENALIPALK